MSAVFNPPLDKLFPRQDFEALKKHNQKKELWLHFFIAFGTPAKDLQSWIDNRKRKAPHHLNAKNLRQLTPLAVVAMQGSVEVALALLAAGADPKIPDDRGWTPLHHAAAWGHEMLIQVLIERMGGKVAAGKFRGANGANYLDIQALFSRQVAKGDKSVCWLRTAQGVKACTAALFKEVTGADYCDGIVVSQKRFFQFWKAGGGTSEDYGLLAAYLANPPKIALRSPEVGSKIGYGVVAEEKICEGRAIICYGGELNVDFRELTPQEQGDYYCGDIAVDGGRIRNLGPMINDGFPNCGFKIVFDKGINQGLFSAISVIQPGEELTWNYGSNHPVKLELAHAETNLAGLRNFATLIEGGSTKSLSTESSAEGFQYLIDTPSSILSLMGQGLFPAKAFEILSGTLSYQMLKVFGDAFRLNVLANCYAIAKQLEEAPKDEEDFVRALLLDWSAHYTMRQVASWLAELKTDLSFAKRWKAPEVTTI